MTTHSSMEEGTPRYLNIEDDLGRPWQFIVRANTDTNELWTWKGEYYHFPFKITHPDGRVFYSQAYHNPRCGDWSSAYYQNWRSSR